jgi:hypothetical protein
VGYVKSLRLDAYVKVVEETLIIYKKDKNLHMCVRVQRGNHYVHLQISLVQSFVLLFQNFEEVVQIIALKRFGGAPHYNQLAPLNVCSISTSSKYWIKLNESMDALERLLVWSKL